MFFQKYFYNVTVLQFFQNPLETHVKWFTFSRVTDLEPKTLPKKDLLHEFYSRILKTSRKHLFWGTVHGGCFCIKSPTLFYWEFLSRYFQRRQNDTYITLFLSSLLKKQRYFLIISLPGIFYKHYTLHYCCLAVSQHIRIEIIFFRYIRMIFYYTEAGKKAVLIRKIVANKWVHEILGQIELFCR